MKSPPPVQHSIRSLTSVRLLRRLFVAALLVTTLFTSRAAADDPLASLMAMYEGVHTHSSGGRLTMVYGAPMTAGATVEEAAERFWNDHGRIFRGLQPQLERNFKAKPKGESPLTVIGYRQVLRGKPVEGSVVRVGLVKVGEQHRVSFATGRLAGEPVIGSEHPVVPAGVAAALVRAQQGFGELTVVGEPEQVVLTGEGARPDAWAWKVRAVSRGASLYEPRTFFLDTTLGTVLKVRQEWANSSASNDINTLVMGYASPGHLPDISTNPPSLTALPRVRVGWSQVGFGVWNEQYTDQYGWATLNIGSHTEVDLRSVLGPTLAKQAEWFFIVNANGSCLNGPQGPCEVHTYSGVDAAEVTADEVSSSTATLTYPGTNEETIAQMNAVVHLEGARRYTLDRINDEAQTFDLLDDTLRVVVNACDGGSLACNAAYFGLTE